MLVASASNVFRCTTSVRLNGLEQVQVCLLSLDASPDDLDTCFGLLSSQERIRAGRFRFERHRRRFVVCRALVRNVLGAHIDVAPEQIRFAYGVHGKPRLDGDVDCGVRFNVSHSGDWALVAITEGKEVGVDIERVTPIDDIEGLMEQVFSPLEQDTLNAVPEPDRLDAFYAGWTRKEAYIKARGDGLQRALDTFDIELAPGEPARLIQVRDEPEEARRWRLESLDTVPGYAAALCVERRRAT